MAEGTQGPGPEGATPLNPQARADIDQALADAGVKGELNPKATEDIDRTLSQAGADNVIVQSF